MSLNNEQRIAIKEKACKGVRYINALPKNRKMVQSRMYQIFKENHTTEHEIHLGRIGKGGDANITKGEEFSRKDKNKEKNFGGNFDTNVGEYRIKDPYKKCNVCGYGLDQRKCDDECNCCSCGAYSDLGACCEYYNNFTEHNTPGPKEE